MLGAIALVVSYFSGPMLNFGDFARYGKSFEAVKKGNFLGLPVNFLVFSLLVVITAAATVPVFGELLTDPVQTVARIDSTTAIVLGALTFTIATIGINIVANFISPAFDFSNVSPQRISWRMGGMIAAVGSVLLTPWNLYSNPEVIHYTLETLGAFIGPLFGVLIADFYLVRKQKIVVDDLFTHGPRPAITGTRRATTRPPWSPPSSARRWPLSRCCWAARHRDDHRGAVQLVHRLRGGVRPLLPARHAGGVEDDGTRPAERRRAGRGLIPARPGYSTSGVSGPYHAAVSLRFATLGLLAQQPGSGYDLLKRFETSMANVWPATQSQLYGELNKLAADGLIEVSEVGPRGRKVYRVTDAGHAELIGTGSPIRRTTRRFAAPRCCGSSCWARSPPHRRARIVQHWPNTPTPR